MLAQPIFQKFFDLELAPKYLHDRQQTQTQKESYILPTLTGSEQVVDGAGHADGVAVRRQNRCVTCPGILDDDSGVERSVKVRIGIRRNVGDFFPNCFGPSVAAQCLNCLK